MHVPAGLEGRGHFLRHRNLRAVAWIASGAWLARLGREHAEAAQLNSVALRQRRRDRVQDGVHDLLRVLAVVVRVLRSDLLNHACGPSVDDLVRRWINALVTW